MTKLMFATAVSVALATPALAAEFYVVQDTSTKKCIIVDKKPTVKTMTVVGPAGKVYATRAEAEAGMKTVTVCSSN